MTHTVQLQLQLPLPRQLQQRRVPITNTAANFMTFITSVKPMTHCTGTTEPVPFLAPVSSACVMLQVWYWFSLVLIRTPLSSNPDKKDELTQGLRATSLPSSELEITPFASSTPKTPKLGFQVTQGHGK